MRIGELSRRTGVPIPTIKYYLREGLLPCGERTSPNQAQYGEEHERRLKLVRAMVDVGKLSVAATRDVLNAVDEPGLGLHKVLGTAHRAVTPEVPEEDGPAWAAAEQVVADLVRRQGWQVETCNPARRALAHLVVTLRDLGQDDLLDALDEYAAAAARLSVVELALISRREGLDAKVEGAVVGTVLGDALISSLRRLAQEDASSRAFEAAPVHA
ncbi:MerR family transcriptional regulator [Kitasatospora sp. NPDC059571]|uniref:MerR family transcriptional regulator n=1 Tax=Kitasatospora sp. NPDC059571 TaxID=3346871 RepID=UPI003698AACB